MSVWRWTSPGPAPVEDTGTEHAGYANAVLNNTNKRLQAFSA